MDFPEIFGFFDTVLFVVLVAGILYLMSNLNYHGIDRKFLLRGFFLKVVATICYLLYHKYVQKIGDIFQYQKDASYLAGLFYDRPSLFFSYLFSAPDPAKFQEMNQNVHLFLFERDEAFVCKLGGVFGIFLNGSFLNVSLIFSLIGFIGNWKIYLLFKRIYPQFSKELGLAILFIPNVIFWSTSITKDSICMGGLGFLVSALYGLLVFKERIKTNLFILTICIIIFFNVKIYILLATLPAILVSFTIKLIRGIKSRILRLLVLPTLIVLIVIGGLGFLDFIENVLQQFAFEKLTETIVTNYEYLSKNTGAGSAYDLGKIEPTFESIFGKFFASVNVSLFRPYVWEIKNLAMVAAALESILATLLTLFVVLKVGVFKLLKGMITNTEVVFCFVFCLIFAFAVGITSGNFGTLLRYKIPMLPFYYAALVLIYKCRNDVKQKPLLENQPNIAL